jgi:imidazolonepropionase-like amidohydrolase
VAAGKADFPKEARVIEASGKTVLPGLIDNHVHYRDLLGELFLAYGVTSVRDLGNPLDWILAQRDAVSQGKIAGPRIFARVAASQQGYSGAPSGACESGRR